MAKKTNAKYITLNWAVKTALPAILVDAGMGALAAKLVSLQVVDAKSAATAFRAVNRAFHALAKERRSGGQDKFHTLCVPEQLLASVQNACGCAKEESGTLAQVEYELESLFAVAKSRPSVRSK